MRNWLFKSYKKKCDVEDFLCGLVAILGYLEPCKFYCFLPKHKFVWVEHHSIAGTQVNVVDSVLETIFKIFTVHACVINTLLHVSDVLCDVTGPSCVAVPACMEFLGGSQVVVTAPFHNEASSLSCRVIQAQAVVAIPGIQHDLDCPGGDSGHQVAGDWHVVHLPLSIHINILEVNGPSKAPILFGGNHHPAQPGQGGGTGGHGLNDAQ